MRAMHLKIRKAYYVTNMYDLAGLRTDC